jgi:hypothetical protein
MTEAEVRQIEELDEYPTHSFPSESDPGSPSMQLSPLMSDPDADDESWRTRNSSGRKWWNAVR